MTIIYDIVLLRKYVYITVHYIIAYVLHHWRCALLWCGLWCGLRSVVVWSVVYGLVWWCGLWSVVVRYVVVWSVVCGGVVHGGVVCAN